jgi:hypothetical protein
MAERSDRGSTNAGFGGFEGFRDPVQVRFAVFFENPEAFEEGLSVRGVRWIERFGPSVQSVDNVLSFSAREFKSGAVAGAVVFC